MRRPLHPVASYKPVTQQSCKCCVVLCNMLYSDVHVHTLVKQASPHLCVYDRERVQVRVMQERRSQSEVRNIEEGDGEEGKEGGREQGGEEEKRAAGQERRSPN